MANESNMLPNDDFNPVSGGNSNGGEQPKKQMFSGAANFFNKITDRVQEIRTPQDEIDANLNNAFFLSDIGGQTDSLIDDKTLGLSMGDPGIIEDGISPTDIAPKDVGVKTVGTVGGQIIGSQPLTVASAGLLPLGLMEKRRKAIRDAAAAKNKKLKALYEIGDVDPRYDMQIRNIATDLALEAAENNIDLDDMSDPKTREFMKKMSTSTSLQRMFNNTDGISVQARALVQSIEESGGKYIMDKKAYNDAINILSGGIDVNELIETPEGLKKLQDIDSAIRLESSASNLYQTSIKPSIEKQITHLFESKPEWSNMANDVIEGEIRQFVTDERIHQMVDQLTYDSNISDKRREQLYAFARASVAEQIKKELKTIGKPDASFFLKTLGSGDDVTNVYGVNEPLSIGSSTGEQVFMDSTKWVVGGTGGKTVNKAVKPDFIMSTTGISMLPSSQGVKMDIQEFHYIEGGVNFNPSQVEAIEKRTPAIEGQQGEYQTGRKVNRAMYNKVAVGMLTQDFIHESYRDELILASGAKNSSNDPSSYFKENESKFNEMGIDNVKKMEEWYKKTLETAMQEGKYMPKGHQILIPATESVYGVVKNAGINLNGWDTYQGKTPPKKEEKPAEENKTNKGRPY